LFPQLKFGVFIALWTRSELRLCWHYQSYCFDSEHLTIYTRVLAHIALVNPEPTLFFFELFVLFTMEPYGFEAAKHDKLGTYGGRVAYLVKATPIFIGCTSPHHHSLASLLSVSGSLTNFSKNYYSYTPIL
jgi:hypothetical protein